MADKTLMPLGSDPFLGKLDYLNTGGLATQYYETQGETEVASLEDRVDAALAEMDFTADEIGNAGFRNLNGNHPKNANGQYAAIPGATAKYARHIPGRNRENYDTLARMYIRVRNPKRPGQIIKNLKSEVSKDVASVMLGDGSAASPARGYIDFFLDGINTSLSEKVQVTEVLEDNFVAFFFGQSPPMYNFTGHVMNTLQDDWAVQMLEAYEELFRGTMLARRGLQLYIRYDSYIISGACTGLSMNRAATNETIIPFTLQMLVHRKHLLYGNAYGATQLPYSAGSFIPDSANPLAYPKVPHLRPLISKAAKTPTDDINTGCVSDPNTGWTEERQEGDEKALNESEVSGQYSEDPVAIPRPTVSSAEPKTAMPDLGRFYF